MKSICFMNQGASHRHLSVGVYYIRPLGLKSGNQLQSKYEKKKHVLKPHAWK
jgi:hypothetical protein